MRQREEFAEFRTMGTSDLQHRLDTSVSSRSHDIIEYPTFLLFSSRSLVLRLMVFFLILCNHVHRHPLSSVLASHTKDMNGRRRRRRRHIA